MTRNELIVLIIIPTILNFSMLVYITKRDKYLNPLGLFSYFLAFIGTFVLFIVLVTNLYNDDWD